MDDLDSNTNNSKVIKLKKDLFLTSNYPESEVKKTSVKIDFEAPTIETPTFQNPLIETREKLNDSSFIRELSDILTFQDLESSISRKQCEDEEVIISHEQISQAQNSLKMSIFNLSDLKVYRDCIGDGAFSRVKKALFKNLELAIKQFKSFNLMEFNKEILILKTYSHPKIPIIYGTMKRNKDNSFMLDIISEFIHGNSLDIYLHYKEKQNKISEIEKYLIMLDLVTVLEFLHQHGLIHRDLKPQNIMINKKKDLKLLDFGISRVTKNNFTMSKNKGTILYMCPEYFPNLNDLASCCDDRSETEQSQSENSSCYKFKISSKIDIWSFGCIFNEVFSGELPWGNHSKNSSVVTNLLMSRYNLPISKKITDIKLRTLIENCVKIDPNERISAREIKQELMKILIGKIKEIKDLNVYFENYNTPKETLILVNKLHCFLNIQRTELTKGPLNCYLDKEDLMRKPTNIIQSFSNKKSKARLMIPKHSVTPLNQIMKPMNITRIKLKKNTTIEPLFKIKVPVYIKMDSGIYSNRKIEKKKSEALKFDSSKNVFDKSEFPFNLIEENEFINTVNHKNDKKVINFLEKKISPLIPYNYHLNSDPIKTESKEKFLHLNDLNKNNNLKRILKKGNNSDFTSFYAANNLGIPNNMFGQLSRLLQIGLNSNKPINTNNMRMRTTNELPILPFIKNSQFDVLKPRNENSNENKKIKWLETQYDYKGATKNKNIRKENNSEEKSPFQKYQAVSKEDSRIINYMKLRNNLVINNIKTNPGDQKDQKTFYKTKNDIEKRRIESEKVKYNIGKRSGSSYYRTSDPSNKIKPPQYPSSKSPSPALGNIFQTSITIENYRTKKTS